MKNIIWVLLLALAAISFGSCNGAGETANTNAGNTNAVTKPAKDLATTLADTEKTAYEAWKKKDGKFFDGFLTDGFVGVSRTGRGQKAGVSKSISENPCEVKSYSTSDAEAVELGEGIALLTMKVASEVSCDGKASPSPQWAATIYVKDGDDWKAAYHQTRATADAKGEYPKAPEGAGDKPADDSDKETTATLSAMDKAGWESWTKRDTKWFEENWADTHVSITPEGRSDRATRLKFHGEHKCEVKSVSHEGQRTSKISDNVVLLTYKSNVDGACDGTAIPKAIWASSIYVKHGEKWKSIFYMLTPAA